MVVKWLNLSCLACANGLNQLFFSFNSGPEIANEALTLGSKHVHVLV